MESHEKLLYGGLTALIRKMLEPVAHDSFLFFDDTTRLLEPEIAPGSRVLDAGCGRGTLTSWLAERGCTVNAIDSNPDHIEQTRHLLESRNLQGKVTLEASKLPDAFPSDHYDVILDCFSWWHISDWGRLFNLSKKNLAPGKKLVILDIFFYWKSTVEFRQKMGELWHTALPTYNECKNMLIKREFRLLKADSIQESFVRYVDGVHAKILEFEKEGLGDCDPIELQGVKAVWDWFRDAAHAEELFAAVVVAELT
jgi:cyclopropane fatty-acyl-phospholipid synthase-like methyltransferase